MCFLSFELSVDNGQVVGDNLKAEVVADLVYVLWDSRASGGVAEAAGAGLRDEVGCDEEGIGTGLRGIYGGFGVGFYVLRVDDRHSIEEGDEQGGCRKD